MNCVLFAEMDNVFSKENNKTLKKILEKWKKILGKSGNFVSPEKWEPCTWAHSSGWTSWCKFIVHHSGKQWWYNMIFGNGAEREDRSVRTLETCTQGRDPVTMGRRPSHYGKPIAWRELETEQQWTAWLLRQNVFFIQADIIFRAHSDCTKYEQKGEHFFLRCLS